jgi:hypothetical protein
MPKSAMRCSREAPPSKVKKKNTTRPRKNHKTTGLRLGLSAFPFDLFCFFFSNVSKNLDVMKSKTQFASP